MPREANPNAGASATLIFSDELEGTVFEPQTAQMYEAEEVREIEGTDVPEFGSWVRATINGEGDGWIVGLAQLERWLATDYNGAGVYEIVDSHKTGSSPEDPYELDIEAIEGKEQTGL
jgi:hypothetical protein